MKIFGKNKEISLKEECEKNKEALIEFRQNFIKEKIEVRKTPCKHNNTNFIKDFVYKKTPKELQSKISKDIYSCLYCYHQYHDLIIQKIDEDYLDELINNQKNEILITKRNEILITSELRAVFSVYFDLKKENKEVSNIYELEIQGYFLYLLKYKNKVITFRPKEISQIIFNPGNFIDIGNGYYEGNLRHVKIEDILKEPQLYFEAKDKDNLLQNSENYSPELKAAVSFATVKNGKIYSLKVQNYTVYLVTYLISGREKILVFRAPEVEQLVYGKGSQFEDEDGNPYIRGTIVGFTIEDVRENSKKFFKIQENLIIKLTQNKVKSKN